MPLYAWRCVCGESVDVFRKLKDYKKPPKHCGKPLTRELSGNHYVWDSFKPYQAVGRGKPFIKTRAEHKAYLARNGYEEIGNDPSMAPPNLHWSPAEEKQEWARKRAEEMRSCEVLDTNSADIA